MVSWGLGVQKLFTCQCAVALLLSSYFLCAYVRIWHACGGLMCSQRLHCGCNEQAFIHSSLFDVFNKTVA